MVEGEGVPGEATIRLQRRCDPFEGAAAVGPRGQVQERAEGAVDQRRWLVEGEIAHVALAQVEVDACLVSTGTGEREHRRRRVNADHLLASCLGDWDGDSAVADR